MTVCWLRSGGRSALVGLLCSLLTWHSANAVQRTWIGGNLNWVDGSGNNANWTGADEPDLDDEANFNTANTVNLGSSNSIADLTMSAGVNLLSNGNQLVVAGSSDLAGNGTTLRVDPHVTPGTVAFQSADLVLKTGGGLTMNGGIAAVTSQIQINAGSALTGFGTVNVGDADFSAVKALDNSGRIEVIGNTAAPQTLLIHANGAVFTDTLDLDGVSEAGIVDVDNAVANSRADTLTLVIDGPLSDAFGGTLQVGQRDTVTFNDNFAMDGAAVQFSGGNNVATMNGPATVTSIVNSTFTATGAAVIANNMTFTGATNSVTINGGSSLTLSGAVTMSPVTLNMAAATSELIVTGSLAVNDPAAVLDWDGASGTTTTIAGSGLMSITADKVDTGSEIYGGTLNLNDDGDLVVNNTAGAWTSSTSINKNNNGSSVISGARVVVQGDLNVNAGSLTMPATTISHTADVTVNGVLTLGGATDLAGPTTLTGSGTLQMAGTSTVSANTVVNVATFDWDGTTTGTTHTINAGAAFTINSPTFDSDGDMDDPITLAGSGAQLIVNGPTQWSDTTAINANSTGTGTVTIGGTSRLILNGASAGLNVHGDTTITAPLTLGANSFAHIDTGFTLATLNNVTFAGAVIDGLGTFAGGAANVVTANTSINSKTFDFDAGTWTVESGARLSFNVTDYDTVSNSPFGSTLTLNNGAITANSAQPAIVMNGTLNMNTTAGGVAEWQGDPIDIGNDSGVFDSALNVSGDGNPNSQARFLTPVRFLSDASMNVAAGGSLLFTSSVTFDTVNGANNAAFTGAGTVAFANVVHVNEAVSLNMVGGGVDLDGNDTIGDFINVNAPLVIHAATVSSFGRVNTSGGTNTIAVDNSFGAGTLTVILDNAADKWTLNSQGVINLVNDNTEATLLAGNAVNVNGTMFVTGNVRTTARLDIAGTININTAGQPLRLNGGTTSDPNTIAGGTISGIGLLAASNGNALQGFGTINTAVDFDDDSRLLADNGTLTINGAITDVGVVGTAESDGVLNVPNAWNNSVSTVVSLTGGTVQGGTITNDTSNGIQGFGTVTARVVNNSQLLSLSSDTLVVQTAANDNDWDGTTGTGQLKATAGATLELRDVGAAFGFTGTVQANSGGRVFANGFALDFNPGSTISLNAGTYESTSGTDIGGTVIVTVGSTSTIKVANNFALTFKSGSTTTLSGSLQLVNNSINIRAGANFGGVGAIVIPSGSQAVADNLSNIGATLNMQGTLIPGGADSIGQVGLTTYQSANTSQLFIELTGTGSSQFDRLVATGNVLVDGYLNIDIDGSFVPVLGNTFNIITGSTVAGTFDYYDVSGMPSGLTFHINYLSNAVQLQVVNQPILSADFDHDGDVDQTDYGIWRGAFNLNAVGDANGDSVSNAADFVLWRKQSGSVPGAGSLAGGGIVPEPTIAPMLAMAWGVLIICRSGLPRITPS